MRVGYVWRRRLKVGAGILILIYLYFFGGWMREHKISYIIRSINREDKSGLWELLKKYNEYPHVVKGRIFDMLSVKLGGEWKKQSIDDLLIEPLSGAFSDLAFLCSLKHSFTSPVLLKILYPSAKSRNEELKIIRMMADNNMGPKLLGSFNGGRFEEHIEGRAIKNEEMKDKRIARSIGEKIAEMHLLVLRNNTQNMIMTLIRQYFELIVNSGNKKFYLKPTIKLFNIPETVTLDQLAIEITKLDEYMTREFREPIGLIHNNLLAGNVLIRLRKQKEFHPEDNIMLIDYEHSIYGHRAADMVSFLSDFEKNPYQAVGTNAIEVDLSFLHSYLYKVYESHGTPNKLKQLKLSGDIELDTKILLKEAELYWPIWNFFWGMVHLVQVIEGNEQMDYEEQFMNRLALYFSIKNQ